MSDKATINLEKENEELAARVKELEASLEAAKTAGAKVAVPVPGKFTVELETPEGKQIKRTIRFKAGRVLCALRTGERVPSEAIMLLANGKKLKPETIEQYPVLQSITKDAAQDHLIWLASIQAGNIEDV